jgi:hypothetical protein
MFVCLPHLALRTFHSPLPSLLVVPRVNISIAHCLDILRQQLMCTVDVGVLGQVWWNREEPTAYPDFNTKHKCRNFEDVRSWAEAHQAPKDIPDDYLMSPRSSEDVYEHIP